jgi:hypothetical protein
MARRRFLAVAAGTVGGLAFVGSHPWRVLVSVVPPSPAARLVSLFAHRDSARALGRVVLRTTRMSRSVPRLVNEVARGIEGGRGTMGRASDAELRDALAKSIRQDFAEDRIVTVDGWILSITETRLYALADLV